MPRAISEKKYEEAMNIYATTNLTVGEIAKQLNIPNSTLYNHAKRNNWELIRETQEDEESELRKCLIFGIKNRDLNTYCRIKDLIQDQLEQKPTTKSLALLTDTYKVAADEVMKLANIKLSELSKEQKAKGESLLDLLAGL